MLIICFRSTACIAFILPKFDPYDDVIPLLHHICNIFLWVIKSASSKLMNIVIQGVHCETMAPMWLSMLLDVMTKSATIVVLQTIPTNYREMLSYVCLMQVSKKPVLNTFCSNIMKYLAPILWNIWHSLSPPAWILTQPLLWDPVNSLVHDLTHNYDTDIQTQWTL